MKRIAALLVVFGCFLVVPVRAEEMAKAADSTSKPAVVATPSATSTTTTTEAAPAPAEAMAPAAVEAAAPAAPASEEVAVPAPATSGAPKEAAAAKAENLEFISGEVSAVDEASKSLTVKLYGETENKPSDKTLKVTVDTGTDITDGEQDRALKSLTTGTEVDVEYDPATNKATYIFVY